MKAISVYDLKLIPELSHLNYFEMVSPSNDHLVNPFLEEMGFDLDYGLLYTVSQHRTLQNTVEIGYVIRGEVNISRKHLTGPWADLQDRLTAAAITDPSLCREMCNQMNTTLDFTAFAEGGADGEGPENFPESLTDPNEKKILAQIKELEELLFLIRGNQYNEDGSLKRPEDYQKPEPVVKKQQKKRSKVA